MDVAKPERFFGVVAMKDTCSSAGCVGAAVAVFPMVTPEDGAGVLWMCDEHAKKMMAQVAASPPASGGSSSVVQEISRTCRLGDDTPCGAAASDVAVVGLRGPDGRAHVSVVSVCARHALQAAPDE